MKLRVVSAEERKGRPTLNIGEDLGGIPVMQVEDILSDKAKTAAFLVLCGSENEESLINDKLKGMIIAAAYSEYKGLMSIPDTYGMKAIVGPQAVGCG